MPSSLQIVLERCEGSIQQINAQQGPQQRLAALSQPDPSGPPVPFSHAISIMFEVALALSAAHSLNVCHKDHPNEVILAVIHGNVHPANILLRSRHSLPVICGWSHSMVRWRSRDGLQHVFSAAEVPDDPIHNAPELQAAEDSQSALEALSDRTDVWGFALVSFFLLTGKKPYQGMRAKHVTRARDNHEPPYSPDEAAAANTDLRQPFARGVLHLLMLCLSEEPEERPTMRQCVCALAPPASRFLQHSLRAVHKEARDAIGKLSEQLRKSKLAAEEARTTQAELQAEAAAARPTYVSEKVSISLHDLCEEVVQQQRPESFVLELGSRRIVAAGDPGARFRLPCSVRGGVFHLRDGDSLCIFGTLCEGVECRRVPPAQPRAPVFAAPLAGAVDAAAEGPPPPRVSFFGDRAIVKAVTAVECGVYLSTACSCVDGCSVTGAVEGMVGVEVVETRGDLRAQRELVLRGLVVDRCRIGLLVKGVPSKVRLEDCRFYGSREHNIWLQKVATRACKVDLHGVEGTGAQRSALLVETLCEAECTGCTFVRNNHYGIQVLPKGVVRYRNCTLDPNRRGATSGKSIYPFE